jgi:chorismate dehydratase
VFRNQTALRLGAVSYLNTKPLVFGLEELLPEGAQLRFELPSRLAGELAAESLDVALVPSIAYARHPNHQIISRSCIACRGPVWSVKLLFRVAPDQVRTLAEDEGSRTSVALARILLWRRYGIQPSSVPFPIGTPPEETVADAVLIIGDRAMHGFGSAWIDEWDLGQQWWHETGLPFVFAMWIGRGGRSDPGLGQTLDQARQDGCRAAEQLAKQYGPQYGLSTADCLAYFRENLHFELGPQELAGLTLFYEQAAQLGLIEHVPELICQESIA